MHPKVQKLIDHQYADQKSQEWLNLRGTMLTASDVATALGENPYEKPSNLILKKCGVPSEFKGNDATRHGEKYEPVARDLYCEKTGEVVHELGLVQHPNISWIGGSPDGVTESGKLIEIKCPMSRKINANVPKHYLAQLQILMEVLDLEECDFIQYRPEPLEYQVTNVQRDRQWFADRLPKLQAFWDEVLYKRENGLCEII
jgi:putative phage-type endonuclease